MSQSSPPKSKKLRTKEKIFKTAVTLFLEQGYENTTVQEITEKAEVAKGTFFSHFPTKEAILRYLGEQRVALMQDHLSHELAAIPAAGEKLLLLFDLLAQANEEDRKVLGLILTERLKSYFSPDQIHVSASQVQLKQIIEGILKEGQATGEFRQDFSPASVAGIFFGIYFFAIYHWLASAQPTSLATEYRQQVTVVLRGIYKDNLHQQEF